MKLIVVLFISLTVNGVEHPAEDLAGDMFLPRVMPDEPECKLYLKRLLRVKDDTLPKVGGRCSTLSAKYLPENFRFHMNRKRENIWDIGD